MKFSSGYILGVATVAACGVSFVGGMMAYSWVNEAKNKKADEIKDTDIINMVVDAIKKKGFNPDG